ncbi:hypothetical protein RZP13_23315, partial [Klebsiella quasipneumoniae subsp. similipneumoniae]|nr:hypothetical protein [Klebsiella quasipneumoniae subsp. similipneumoniae]
HDVPLGCAPDEYDDLISGTCSHLPLTTEEDWYPDEYPNILEAPCQAIKDPQAMTEYTRDHARWFPIIF